MIAIATGWLGWPFDVAMRTDLGAIELAYGGKIDMLQAIYGKADSEPAPVIPSKRKLTPELFRAMFG